MLCSSFFLLRRQRLFFFSLFCFISSQPSSSSSSLPAFFGGECETGRNERLLFLSREVESRLFLLIRPGRKVLLFIVDDLECARDFCSSVGAIDTGRYRDGMPILLRSDGAIEVAYPGLDLPSPLLILGVTDCRSFICGDGHDCGGPVEPIILITRPECGWSLGRLSVACGPEEFGRWGWPAAGGTGGGIIVGDGPGIVAGG